MSTEITFKYKNHRGEVADRTVLDHVLTFKLQPGYGYQPGWFIHGLDKDRGEIRTFALCNIILPPGEDFYIGPVIHPDNWGQ